MHIVGLFRANYDYDFFISPSNFIQGTYDGF